MEWGRWHGPGGLRRAGGFGVLATAVAPSVLTAGRVAWPGWVQTATPPLTGPCYISASINVYIDAGDSVYR